MFYLELNYTKNDKQSKQNQYLSQLSIKQSNAAVRTQEKEQLIAELKA
jgi:hypothetical protein